MKAIIRTKAGKDFSSMQVLEIEKPVVEQGKLKVKMISSRINPVDMDLMKGFPTLKYNKQQIGGIDGAGIVLEIGEKSLGFEIGDTVFFYRKFSDLGTWAEEITVNAKDCAKVPDNIKVVDAGSIALPLLTAYESIIQFGAKAGEKILIHGVGGGVGFQALLVAKKLGLFVIGTASQNDEALLKKAGLDQLIDYKKYDFSQVLRPKEIDYILDVLGDETLLKSILLKPKMVVSLKYIDTNNMSKTGVKLPRILKWIINLTMNKYSKLASKNNVKLVGQVTGANGKLLQEAVNLISLSYISKPYPIYPFKQIEQNKLSKKDIGKVIVF